MRSGWRRRCRSWSEPAAGASAGVLIKNAEALEVLEKVDTLVVDKTGTLTEGKPKLVSVVPAAGSDEPELLRLAASLERGSEHPLAAAIAAGAQERGLELTSAQQFQSSTGQGVQGQVEGRAVAVGNRGFFDELGIDLAPWPARPRSFARAARPSSSSPSTASRRACSASPTRSRNRPPTRSSCSIAKGSAS